MGNQLTCMANTKSVKQSHIKKKSSRKAQLDEELLQQQVLAMALYHQKAQMRVDRTMSQRHSDVGVSASLQKGFPRSSSARPRSIADPDLPPQQLLNIIQRAAFASMESKHFVLVHGGGYGAWCWYKSIALLEECGFIATAIDLAGSGIESTDPNSITSLSQYAKPLSEFLEKLAEGEKVILIGHDFGGACISYAMECFSKKIAKAVFLAAAMVKNGQRAFDVFAPEVMSADDLLPKAQVFAYANGDSNPPTALGFERSVLKDLFFNRSPAKDVALATVSLRLIPFAPVLEKLALTDENYGTVRRFFIQTTDDNALTPALQERLVSLNPPERVFKVKGSDHSPFFSKPQSLHKILVEIAQLDPPTRGN